MPGYAAGALVVLPSRRGHTRYWRDWSSDVCSSDLAASSSTWPPWVSQLPYAISEMVRPERPRRLNSTPADASGDRLDLRAERDLGLGEPPAADHGGAADAVPDQAAGLPRLRVVREALGELALDLPAQHHRVDDQQEEEAEQHKAGVALHGQAGHE